MAIGYTQKEKMLLEDQRKHEQVCVDKYSAYAAQAKDPQLTQLFNAYAGQEQQHLNSINQMLSGQVPNMGQQSQQQNTSAQPAGKAGMSNKDDASLCNDMLMTEKYVSSSYNTAVFEFRDANIRNALNHIQKEEQQHGEGIFNYMQSNGMYNAQQ